MSYTEWKHGLISDDEIAEEEETYSEEDIINYLIETGVSLELLAYEADY